MGIARRVRYMLLAFWIAGAVWGQEVDFPSIQDQYPQRQKAVLEKIAGNDSGDVIEQAVVLQAVRRDDKAANFLALSFVSEDRSLSQCLTALRLLYAGRRESSGITPETCDHLESELSQWYQANPLSGPSSTIPSLENNDLLDEAFQYLWAQYIHDATPEYSWLDGENSETHLQSAYDYLRDLLLKRFRQGCCERVLPNLSNDMAALLAVRDWSHEETLRVIADANLDLIFAQIAQESLHGWWGGVPLRSLKDLNDQSDQWIQYIVFGWPSSNPADLSADMLAFYLALSGYRPPPVLLRLSREYSYRGRYEIKERFAFQSREGGSSFPLYKYSYVTPQFILGSFALRDQRVPRHARPWDLMVLDPNQNANHLFTFTGNELISGGMWARDEDQYLWNSDCLQYKNVLFCRFHRCGRLRPNAGLDEERIDDRYVQWPTRVWVPNAFGPVSQEGDWWFARIGSVYLAFRPLEGRSYWWQTTPANSAMGQGVSILTFQNLFTSFLLEVEDESHFTSFEQFEKEMQNSPLEIDDDSVTFVSRRGDVFLFPLGNDDFLVNGRVVDPRADEQYRLIGSPFVDANFGEGKLHAEWQNYSLSIDLSDSQNPKRVILPE